MVDLKLEQVSVQLIGEACLILPICGCSSVLLHSRGVLNNNCFIRQETKNWEIYEKNCCVAMRFVVEVASSSWYLIDKFENALSY